MDLTIQQRAAETNLAFLKTINRIDQTFACGIPVNNGAALVVAFNQLHLRDESLIRRLAQWTAASIEAPPDSTARYLREILDTPNRALFLVVANSCDVVARFEVQCAAQPPVVFTFKNLAGDGSEAACRLIPDSLAAFIQWAREVCGIQVFNAIVSAGAEHSKQSFCSASFSEVKPSPPAVEAGSVLLHYQERDADAGKSMILTAGPSISQREAWYAFDAARSGWNNRWSGYLTEFEREFASYVGAKHALATSSCTGALHIALVALGIGPGDEVIVPDLTWVATANAVRYAGATPVFADIELDTWNIDASSAESLITPRTKAIMPVHMYGHPARMTPLLDLAKRHGLRIVEDAAPAIGAEWQGRRCGSFGDFGAFSFQGAKLLVTGEGGMLVTNDDELYERAYRVWDQGRDPSRTFWIDRHGLKYKMANVQAAIGLGQLQRCDELVEMKRRVFSWYDEELAGVDHVRLNREVPGARSIYWMSSLFLDEASGKDRETIRAELKRRNIDTRPVFPAISQYPIWERAIAPQPTAARVGRQAMNLPSGVCLTRAQVAYVCANIRELLSSP